MATSESLEYAIIGGGIAGLSLAIALHSRGLNVRVYEQSSGFGEIGAGVSFTRNASEAMKICHPGIHDAFEKVCTRNVWPSKRWVWFDYYDGQNEHEDGKPNNPLFTITSAVGQNGVHRASYLNELVKLFPSDRAFFHKHLETFRRDEDGKYVLTFSDGSHVKADAVLGCDGIKSKVRRLLFGEDHPCAHPTYTHMYAYRALAPMEDMIAAIGEEKAQNACVHMGKGGHVLMFPINHGQTANVVAFTSTKNDWPDHSKLTAPATREDALRDFADYGPSVQKILRLVKPELDTWAIFNLGNPPPSYNKDRVCLVGDAAHATSPHHGAGAGFCLEDSAILSSLLADERVTSGPAVEAALAAYDAIRRERGDWLVKSSAFMGPVYQLRGEGIGDDFTKMEAEIKRRNGLIADVDVGSICEAAREELGKRLKSV